MELRPYTGKYQIHVPCFIAYRLISHFFLSRVFLFDWIVYAVTNIVTDAHPHLLSCVFYAYICPVQSYVIYFCGFVCRSVSCCRWQFC